VARQRSVAGAGSGASQVTCTSAVRIQFGTRLRRRIAAGRVERRGQRQPLGGLVLGMQIELGTAGFMALAHMDVLDAAGTQAQQTDRPRQRPPGE